MESTYKFHKIDQTVSVLPSLVPVAAQGRDIDVLGLVELVQRFGEQVHGVIDEGRLRLKVKTITRIIDHQSKLALSEALCPFDGS